MEIKFSDGNYEGPVSNGKPHGNGGRYYFNDGKHFSGDFKNGKACGYGDFYLKKQGATRITSYEFDGFYNAKNAIYYDSNTSKRTYGELKNGVFIVEDNGEKLDLGLKASATSKSTVAKTSTTAKKQTSSSSKQLYDYYVAHKDEFEEKKTTIKLYNGTYTGEVNKKGLPHGDGILKLKDGTVVDGEWANGDLLGYATITFSSGVEIDGEFNTFHSATDASYDTEDLDEILIGEIINDVFYGEDGEKFALETVLLSPVSLDVKPTATKISATTKKPQAQKSVIPPAKLVTTSTSSSAIAIQKSSYPTPTPAKNVDIKPKTTKLRLNDGSYEGEVKNGVPNGKGKIVYNDGHSYEGDFVNGKRVGFGTLYFVTGDKLECQFKDDYPNGEGTVYYDGKPHKGEFIGDITNFYNCYHRDFETGNSYSGAFLNGKYHGKGIWDSAKGTHYQGEFAYGKFNGYGEITFENHAKYEGEFKDNLYHGKGIYRFPDWSNVRGEFRNGSPHGYCEYHGDDGTIYKGEYKNGKWHGQGKLSRANGYTFEGEFHEGKGVKENPKPVKKEERIQNVPWTREGTLTNDKGTRYVGEHLNGVPHGKGRMVFPNGQTYDGEFRNGKFHGVGKMQFPNGTKHEGCYLNGVRHSKGKMTFPDGSFYDGTFKDDMFDGLGTLVDTKSGWTHYGCFVKDQLNGYAESHRRSTGEKYAGSYVNGKLNGKGKYTYEGGTTYEGEWLNDMRHGKGYQVDASGFTFRGEYRNDAVYGNGELTRDDGVVIKGYFTDFNNATNAVCTFKGTTMRGIYVNGQMQGKYDEPTDDED